MIKKKRFVWNNAIAISGCNGHKQSIFIVWNPRQPSIQWVRREEWSEWKWWAKTEQEGEKVLGDCYSWWVSNVAISLGLCRAYRLHQEGESHTSSPTKARLQPDAVCGAEAERFVQLGTGAVEEGRRDPKSEGSQPQRGARRLAERKLLMSTSKSLFLYASANRQLSS